MELPPVGLPIRVTVLCDVQIFWAPLHTDVTVQWWQLTFSLLRFPFYYCTFTDSRNHRKSQVTGDVAEDVRLKMENGWYVGLNTPMGPYKNHIRKNFAGGIGHKGHFCGL